MIAVRHAGIVVSDMEAALGFYCGQLGFQVARRMVETGPFIATLLGMHGAEVETAKLSGADTAMIELLHFRNPAPRPRGDLTLNRLGPTHVALTVTDLDGLYRRLTQQEISFVAPPHVSPDGKAKVAFCRDPEGNYLELVEMVG
jgi:catechol 2,3-dioxygenase-like lactoylglutathione lyase family enzyme